MNDEYAYVGTHWIDLFCRKNEIASVHIFGVEHVPEELKNLLETKT